MEKALTTAIEKEMMHATRRTGRGEAKTAIKETKIKDDWEDIDSLNLNLPQKRFSLVPKGNERIIVSFLSSLICLG